MSNAVRSSTIADTQTDIIRRFPFRGPFFERISDRKRKGRDAKIMVTANGETGVGKTHLAYYLALVLDTSSQGFVVSEKATTSMQEFLSMYDNLPKGSAMMFDESEQLDSRRAMREENVDTALKIMTRRLNELVQVFVLPAKKPLDPRIEGFMNFWVYVDKRGTAIIYQDTSSQWQDPFWSEIQQFHWPNLDPTGGIDRLDQLKHDLIDSENADDVYVRQDEAEEEMQQKTADLRQERRDLYIQKRAAEGISHSQIRDEVEDEFDDDLSRQRVSQIVRAGDQ